MRFRRNARMLGNTLDAAAIASVFFLLVIFVMLGSLVYTPGIYVKLPAANDLPGTDKPSVTVAVDANNRLYYADQLISEADLKLRLAAAVTNSSVPLTLVVRADEAVSHKQIVRLELLARDAGFEAALLATLPRVIPVPLQDGTPAKP